MLVDMGQGISVCKTELLRILTEYSGGGQRVEW